MCVTVLMAPAATTSMEAVCVSRGFMGHTAGTGCVRPENTACTVNARVSVRINTLSAATQ